MDDQTSNTVQLPPLTIPERLSRLERRIHTTEMALARTMEALRELTRLTRRLAARDPLSSPPPTTPSDPDE